MAKTTTNPDPNRGGGDGDGSADLWQFVEYKDPAWGKGVKAIQIPILTKMSADGKTDLSLLKSKVGKKKINFEVIKVEDKQGNVSYGAINWTLSR
ncbi:MAG: hypothetical protein KDD32_00640 [Bacteroidetes bacterium]|nr:hypothetical protein [Bacteroidota bacterium]